MSLLAAPIFASETQEIYKLKQQIVEVTSQHTQLLRHSELKANQRLARYQSKLLIKTLSYEIQTYLRKQGTKRRYSDIEKIVEAYYACTWTFTDLGKDHLERLVNFLQWPRDESGFQPGMVSHWKAGTYLESIGKMVLKNSSDYGHSQINDQHIKALRNINRLFSSGVIPIKVNRIRSVKDMMDINTNCVARCVIEVDRKARGWEWQHVRDKKFRQMVIAKIVELEKQRLYNRHFVEKYYFATPIKHYNRVHFDF